MWRIEPYFIFILSMVCILAAKAETLRDPTSPGDKEGSLPGLSGTPIHMNTLVLNSVVINGDTAHAVINNQILSVGDSIQGLEIVKITSSYVSLADGRRLIMFQAIIAR